MPTGKIKISASRAHKEHLSRLPISNLDDKIIVDGNQVGLTYLFAGKVIWWDHSQIFIWPTLFIACINSFFRFSKEFKRIYRPQIMHTLQPPICLNRIF